MTQEFPGFDVPPEEGDISLTSDTLPASEVLPGEHNVSLRERAGQLIAGYGSWAEKYPFAATAVETAVVFAAKKVATFVGDKVGLNVRNALAEDHLETAREHPVKAAAQLVLLAPVAEELQYRGPSWLRRHVGDRQPSRVLDCVMALGFAAGHAGVIKPAEKWTKPPFVQINTENLSVPIVPLMGGINYERQSRKRGFGHAILAHALNNTLEGMQAIPEVRRRRRK